MATAPTRQNKPLIDTSCFPQQDAVLFSDAQITGFVGGAGSGKSLTGVAWSLKKAVEQPGSRGMMVGSTHPQLSQSIIPYLEQKGRETGLDDVWNWNKTDKQITLPNGSVFWLRSADKPGSLLAADLAWFYGDEIGLWRKKAWEYLLGRLRQPDYETSALVTFTPKGSGHWTADVFQEPSERINVVNISAAENPYIADDRLEMLRELYGEGTPLWEQEVLGKFVAFEGLIYPDFSEEQYVVAQLPADVRFSRIIAGVDWGWTNPGVILILGIGANNTVWVLDEIVRSEVPVTGEQSEITWVSLAQSLQKAHGISALACDPSEPGNIDIFNRNGLPAMKADNSVETGIGTVTGLIRNDRLRVLEGCTHTIAEFGQYQRKVDVDGNVQPSVVKANDHAMDALRYGIMELMQQQTQRAPRSFQG